MRHFMQIELTPTNILLFGIIAGAVFGLIPLIIGLIKKNLKFGTIGFFGSIIGGAIFGIYLAIPVSAVCSYLILRRSVLQDGAQSGSEVQTVADAAPVKTEIP